MSSKHQRDWFWVLPAPTSQRNQKVEETVNSRKLLLIRSSTYRPHTSHSWVGLDTSGRSLFQIYTQSLLWSLNNIYWWDCLLSFLPPVTWRKKKIRISIGFNLKMGQYTLTVVITEDKLPWSQALLIEDSCLELKKIVPLVVWMGPDHSRICGLSCRTCFAKRSLTNVSIILPKNYWAVRAQWAAALWHH